MARPLVAQFRVEMLYDVPVAGFPLQHKYQPYCRVLDTGVPGPGRYQLVTRGGSAGTDWSLYVGHLASMMGDLFSTAAGSVPYNAELQSYVGGEWLPLDSATGTITGSRAGADNTPALQITTSLIDSAFARVRVEFFEGDFSYPLKFISVAAAIPTGFWAKWTIASASPLDPWQWVVSRSNLYLADNPFRSQSLYPNRKLVRRRSL